MTVPPSEFYPYMPTRITVPWLDLGDVRNCAGHLTRGPCGRARTTAPAVSVNDARTEEARGASLDFAVTLSRALSETVTVRYAAEAERGNAAGSSCSQPVVEDVYAALEQHARDEDDQAQ